MEYFAIGDISGQLTIMEVPKLFSEKVNFNLTQKIFIF